MVADEIDAVELLRKLIRFDTSNPPGGERECIEWVRGLLEELGCEVRLLGREPERPNLVARLAGRGAAPPLLLQGHVDVVPAGSGRWRHDPFGGELVDGEVWGRGALDMKGGVAIMLAAFMQAKASGIEPAGDVILCLLADEEAGSDLGANFLVAEHPELFEGVRYSIGEFGGFTMELAGARLYPIMVAEKQICWARARLQGPGGHGSLPISGGAMGKLGRVLSKLDRRRLPVHVTPLVRSSIKAIAAEAPAPIALPLRGLLVPALTDRILDAMGERGRSFDPVLHNTASGIIVRGGEHANVIPDEVTLDLDIRLLPGFRPEDAFEELRRLSGVEMEFELLRHDPAQADPDLSLFDALAGILRELDPNARPIPLLLPAATDGRFFARLGIQTYGFLPMQLPPQMRFMDLIHADDERVPANAIEFGARAVGMLLERFA
jgi:acetylornithine deacetylase/succinyl-diaminopimelate desuccinylase-like protein